MPHYLKQRFEAIGKLILTNENLQSVRPFSLDKKVDPEMKERILDHLKPICNVIYAKGEYYVYQADSLMKEPGLTAELSKKSQVDRYFVTSQIKSIAMKASVVVRDAKVHELTPHLTALNFEKPKKRFSEDDSEEDDDDELTPMK